MIERVYVEIGNICNLSCSFCAGTKRAARRMSVAEFSTVISKLSGHTKYVYLHVMGEPLLHPELGEILGEVERAGLRAVITTNGLLLPERAELLLSSASVLHKVSVSLHSLEGNGAERQMQDYVLGVSDYAKKASEAGIYTVLRLWNADSSERQGKNSLNGDIERILKAQFPEPWQRRHSGYRLMKGLFLEYAEIFTWPKESEAEPRREGRCHGLISQLAVLADGTVVPCCLDCDGEIPLGNIFASSLDEILSSPRALEMSRALSSGRFSEELCQKCTYARRFKSK